MKPVTWLFSGQGSQFYQMARELYDGDPVFRRELERGDAIVRPLLNVSLIEEIYRARADRFEPFRRVAFTHPALLMVEHALAQMLFARGQRPERVAGHSLGEIAAFVVAGAIDFEAALTSVVKQGLVLEYLAPRGAMMAVLAPSELFAQEPALFAGCELAGVVFGRSFVIGGPVAEVQAARTRLKARQVDTYDLPVEHPFHTSAMASVKAPVMAALGGVTFGTPQIPVFSVAAAGLVAQPSAEHLWFATSSRTDFPAAVRALEAGGPSIYVDLGPGGGLSTTIKYTLPQGAASELIPLVTMFGHESRNLERLATRLKTR
ncbi:MAG TPA: acyltransferase domain-containing protein [Opitutaceae bacterium]